MMPSTKAGAVGSEVEPAYGMIWRTAMMSRTNVSGPIPNEISRSSAAPSGMPHCKRGGRESGVGDQRSGDQRSVRNPQPALLSLVSDNQGSASQLRRPPPAPTLSSAYEIPNRPGHQTRSGGVSRHASSGSRRAAGADGSVCGGAQPSDRGSRG